MKELEEIDLEDLKFIFQDILDLEIISKFEYSNLEISFIERNNEDFSKKDYKSIGEFYILLDKCLKQLKASYNVELEISNSYYTEEENVWTIYLEYLNN